MSSTNTYFRPYRLLPVLIGLLVTLCFFAGQPAHAHAAEPGVVPDLTWFPTESGRDRTAIQLQDVGSRWVRLDVGWRDFEPIRGSYSSWALAAYEKEFQRARDAGQRIVVMVHTSPLWASGSSNMHAPPRDPADYARFLRFLVQQYGSYVDAWEIWNEPNISRFWPTGPDPAEYTSLLKAAYPAVKAEDPGAKVVFGGLSTNDWSFVEGAYAAGAKGYFDVMATHPYSCAKSPEKIERYTNGRMTRGSFPAYREVRASMLAQGDDRPIWFTEFGWSTTTAECGVSEAIQADYLTRAFKYVEQDPYVQVATWYNFRNNFWAGDADDIGSRFGLLNTDFTPKLAYSAFKAYAGGSPSPIPSSEPSSSPTPAPAPAPTPAPAPAPTKAPSTVAFTAPAEGERFDKTLAMSASVSGDKAITNVQFRVDGRLVQTDAAAPYAYTWSVPKKMSYGTHIAEVRAYDAQGLVAKGTRSIVRTRGTITLRVARAASATTARGRRASVRTWGRVRGVARRVRLDVYRQLASGRLIKFGVTRSTILRKGRFNSQLGPLGRGRWRIRATIPARPAAGSAVQELRI
jgi:hypothetical protein